MNTFDRDVDRWLKEFARMSMGELMREVRGITEQWEPCGRCNRRGTVLMSPLNDPAMREKSGQCPKCNGVGEVKVES